MTVLPSPENVTAGSPLSSSCFRICRWVSLTFQTVAFALDLRASEFSRELFKSVFSIPHSSMAPLDLIPIDFQNQAFGGLIFLVLDPGVKVPDVGHRPFTL